MPQITSADSKRSVEFPFRELPQGEHPTIFQRTGDCSIAITCVHDILFSQHPLGPCTASTAIQGIKEGKPRVRQSR